MSLGHGVIGFLLSDLNLYEESYFENKVGDTGHDKQRDIWDYVLVLYQ